MQDVKLKVFNAGQGLCSVVRGVKDDGAPYCGIFDCGTLAYNPLHSKEMLLNEIFEFIGEQCPITDVVVSHQDVDHWSLLMDILARYFKMPKGCIYYKGETEWFLYKNGTEFYKISESTSLEAYFEGAFEENSYEQNINYTILDDDSVISLTYEGTFYEVGKKWEIKISIVPGFSEEEPRIWQIDLVCENDAGETIAEASLTETDGIQSITDCADLVEGGIDLALENISIYQPFGRRDEIFLKGHIRAVIKLVREKSESFSDIFGLFGSLPENPAVSPIQNIVWGGAEPGPQCKLSQNMMDKMQMCGYIGHFYQYPDGAYVKFENDQLDLTDAAHMICTDYSGDMTDVKGETIQQLNIKRNVTSAVTCMKFADQSRFLFPGDITVHRFGLLVNAVHEVNAYAESVMIAPHHGSDVTNFCESVDVDSEDQPLQHLFKVFENDSRRIFVVSALVSQFGHPGKNFLDCAVNHASDSNKEHLVSYGNILCRLQAEKTGKDVYCTEMRDGFCYPDSIQNAVCSGFWQAQPMRPKCKAPSKRLFI